MPYVNIKVTDEGVTVEQKQRLISGISQLLQEILNKDPGTTPSVTEESRKILLGQNDRSVAV